MRTRRQGDPTPSRNPSLTELEITLSGGTGTGGKAHQCCEGGEFEFEFETKDVESR